MFNKSYKKVILRISIVHFLIDYQKYKYEVIEIQLLFY